MRIAFDNSSIHPFIKDRISLDDLRTVVTGCEATAAIEHGILYHGFHAIRVHAVSVDRLNEELAEYVKKNPLQLFNLLQEEARKPKPQHTSPLTLLLPHLDVRSLIATDPSSRDLRRLTAGDKAINGWHRFQISRQKKNKVYSYDVRDKVFHDGNGGAFLIVLLHEGIYTDIPPKGIFD